MEKEMKIVKSDPVKRWDGKEEEEITDTEEIKFVSTDKTFEISFTDEGHLKIRKSKARDDQIQILPHCGNCVIIS